MVCDLDMRITKQGIGRLAVDRFDAADLYVDNEAFELAGLRGIKAIVIGARFQKSGECKSRIDVAIVWSRPSILRLVQRN
jgi:hypothetical protein